MYLTQRSKLRRWNWKSSESRKTKTVKWNLTWKFSRWCDDGVKNVEFITRTFSWYWVGMKDDHVISSESVEAGLGGRSENMWGQDLLLNLPKKREVPSGSAGPAVMAQVYKYSHLSNTRYEQPRLLIYEFLPRCTFFFYVVKAFFSCTKQKILPSILTRLCIPTSSFIR